MYRTDFLDSVGEGESGMIWENGTEMYTIMEETNRQSMFDTGYRMLGAGARGRSREMIQGGRWEGGSCLGTHVHSWWIHVNVWQNQYSIIK